MVTPESFTVWAPQREIGGDAVMSCRTNEDEPQEQLCVASDTQRSHPLLHETEAETQFRVTARLRAMYADLLAEPVPAHLLKLIREVEIREASRHDA